MKVFKKALVALIAAPLIPAKTALAVCPICTVAVAGGLGILERYGVDDAISGLWVGALLVSVSMWTNDFLRKRQWTFPYYRLVTFVAYYALTLIPLYAKDYLFAGTSYMWGIDRLFFGIILGSILFAFGALSYDAYKFSHRKALFPFQKVAQPIGIVALATAVLYFLVS